MEDFKNYIELITIIIGSLFLFIPDSGALKIIIALVVALIIALIRIYKLKNDKEKMKYNKKLNSKILREIRKKLYESGSIDFIQTHDFSDAYPVNFFKPINEYLYKTENDPEFNFLDTDLKILKENLDYHISKFSDVLGNNSHDLLVRKDLVGIPKDWRERLPQHRKKIVEEANHHARKIVENYTELIQLARKKQIDYE